MTISGFSKLDLIVDADSEDFTSLVEISGLDPGVDFVSTDLSDVDFGTADLTMFSFRGSNLDRSDLSRATLTRKSLLGASLEGTKMPPSFEEEDDYDDGLLVIPIVDSMGYWAKGRAKLVLRQFITQFLRFPEEEILSFIAYSRDFPALSIDYGESAVDAFGFDLPPTMSKVVKKQLQFNSGGLAQMISRVAIHADLRRNFTFHMVKELFRLFGPRS